MNENEIAAIAEVKILILERMANVHCNPHLKWTLKWMELIGIENSFWEIKIAKIALFTIPVYDPIYKSNLTGSTHRSLNGLLWRIILRYYFNDITVYF